MRALVVLRTGPKSLHRNWTSPQRDWKLAISSFGSRDAADYPEADYFQFFKGGKWDGIHAFFEAHPELLEEFDTFWLPDDDIDATPADIATMFDLFASHHLELAQPCLTRNSYFCHQITMQNKLTAIRYTNFVEIMVPLLTRNVLNQVLPLFRRSKSGFGMDYFWSRLTSDPPTKCAILDQVAVHHTRPIGSVLAKEIEQDGSSSRDQELRALLLAVNCPTLFYPLNVSVTTNSGRHLDGSFACGIAQFVSHIIWPATQLSWRQNFRTSLQSLYWHLKFRPDLSLVSTDVLRNAY